MDDFKPVQTITSHEGHEISLSFTEENEETFRLTAKGKLTKGAKKNTTETVEKHAGRDMGILAVHQLIVGSLSWEDCVGKLEVTDWEPEAQPIS